MVTDAAAAASLSTISATPRSAISQRSSLKPIQGNGGIIPLPDKYIQQLRQICTDTGTLLIADEVQTGFARTGTMFAIEQSGVVPDIMTVAKALGVWLPDCRLLHNRHDQQAFTKPSAPTPREPCFFIRRIGSHSIYKKGKSCTPSERTGRKNS